MVTVSPETEGVEGRYHPFTLAQHAIKSCFVPETFEIKVLVPIRRDDDTERFPVLYATDGDDFFGGLHDLARTLQLHGETPRFILVAIGYGSSERAAVLRMRDFLTHSVRSRFQSVIEQAIRSPLIDRSVDYRAITNSTDATQFLRFIREELMPFVNTHYPTAPQDNNFFGYSAGGSFGLYTLFTQPTTFKRYVLGSPASSFGGHNFGIEMAKSFIETGGTLQASLYMSVGELEEFRKGLDRFDFVTGYYQLAKLLRASPINGLDLQLRVFPSETHATAWAPAFSHGTRALWGSTTAVPFLPDYLK